MTRHRYFSTVAVALVASAALGAYGASAAPPAASATESADSDATVVTHWNAVAASTLVAVPGPDGGTPPSFQINMGITQGAVYDAVNAIGPQEHEPYLLETRFGGRASTDAAAATAAYDVLVQLVSSAPERAPFPGRRALLDTLSAEYANSLAAVADGRSKWEGVAAGHAAADAMLEAREDDGRFGPSPWVPNAAPGHWAPLLN